MKPIITKDSNEEYHSKKEYASSSVLKQIKESPLHWKEKEKKQTDALEIGSAYHVFILEPEVFDQTYYVFDDVEKCRELREVGYFDEKGKRKFSKQPKSTNVYKDWLANEIRIANGKLMLSSETYQIMVAMKKRLYMYPYAVWLLTKGKNETSHYLELNGVKCKFRTDSQHDNKRVISDLKLVVDASTQGFIRKYVCEYDAHISAAFYCDCYEQIYGTDGSIPQFFWVAQEKTAPYAVNIIKASPQLLGVGRYEYEILLQQYKYCIETGKYPGYEVFANNKFGIVEASLPAWKIKELNFYNQFNK